MARMKGLSDSEASWISRFIFRGIRRRVGRVGDTWRIAAHAPGLLLGIALKEVAYDRVRGIDRSLRTLVQIKVAMLVGCPV